MPNEFRVRLTEGQRPPANLLWDSVYDNDAGFADWCLSGFADAGNRGGLTAQAQLPTAVVLCLFTDRRCPDDHPLRKWAGDDLRGWWGDGVDVQEERGERPLGSLLWLLRNAAFADPAALGGISIERWAETMAEDALQTLVDQGAAARIEAVATVSDHRLDLALRLYDASGATLLDRRFTDLWKRL